MGRRMFNPVGGKVALAAGAAIIAGLAAANAYAKSKVKKKKKPVDETELPPPDDMEKQIADELLGFVSEEPVPGSLYLIRKGDNFNSVVRSVFAAAGIPEAADNGQARVAYMQCTSSSPYNRTLFGNEGDFTDKFPSYTSPDNVSIRSAFLNKSTDYITQLLGGNLPTKKGGGTYGLLWLPSVDAAAWQQFKRIVCVNIDPPPLTTTQG